MSTKYMKLTYKPLRHPDIRPIREGSRSIGYEFPLYLNYYRGIHLSCINEFEIKVDGQTISPLCQLGDKLFKPEEFKDMYKEWWGVRTPMMIKVYNNEGICAGEHDVSVHCICKCAYMKFAPGVYAQFDSSDARTMTVKEDYT